MQRSVLATAAVVLFTGITAPLAAQRPSVAPSPSVLEHSAALRRLAEAPVAGETTRVRAYTGRERRQGTVLMIVGAAGIVTGLIVDEDLVTIAGAVVGGIGLYMYLDNGGAVRVGARGTVPMRF